MLFGIGLFQARQSLIVRGLFPMLADPRHPVSSVFHLFYMMDSVNDAFSFISESAFSFVIL